jgi:hypoxanthine phosphoribosyltransferase
VKRLNVPPPAAGPVREIDWAEFGDLARELADDIAAAYRPEVVLGILNGGVFVGGVLAPALRAELHPVRVERKGRRRSVPEKPIGLRGRSVLVVDDIIVSGATMAAAVAAARRAGAKEIRTAALVARPRGARPDFHAVEATEVVVFGWDYGLDRGGAGGGGEGGDPGEVGV